MCMRRFRTHLLTFAIVPAVWLASAYPVEAKALPEELASKDHASVFTPASAWQLDMGEDRCTLARKFQSGQGTGLVVFEQFAPGADFDVTLAAPYLAFARRGAWTYGGMRKDWPVAVISPLEFHLTGYGEALTLARATINGEPAPGTVATNIDPQAALLTERIVYQRAATIVAFETGSMKEPFEALNICSAGLLESLEIETPEQPLASLPIMPQRGLYFSRLNKTMFEKAMLGGSGAILRIRARIEPDGTVSRCWHQYALIAGKDLPDVCSDLRGMQFEPAVDHAGEPVAYLFATSVPLYPWGAWNSDAGGARWGETD